MKQPGLILIGLGIVFFGSMSVMTSMNDHIYKIKAENSFLEDKISIFEMQADELSSEIDDLNSKIDDMSIDDYDSSMQDVHAELDDVENKLNEIKSEF